MTPWDTFYSSLHRVYARGCGARCRLRYRLPAMWRQATHTSSTRGSRTARRARTARRTRKGYRRGQRGKNSLWSRLGPGRASSGCTWRPSSKRCGPASIPFRCTLHQTVSYLSMHIAPGCVLFIFHIAPGCVLFIFGWHEKKRPIYRPTPPTSVAYHLNLASGCGAYHLNLASGCVLRKCCWDI